MKKIIPIIFFLLWKLTSVAQIYLPSTPTDYGTKFNRLKPVLVLHVPESTDTLVNTTDNSSQMRIINGKAKYWYGGRWNNMGGSDIAPALQPVTESGDTTNHLLTIQGKSIGSGNLRTNLIFGNKAFNSNTTGANNVAIGDSSLANNTTGYANTSLGYSSMVKNTTGGINLALGSGTLHDNQTSAFNTVVGTYAMFQHLTGDSNTAVGFAAMNTDISGRGNTAVGSSAMRKNISGYENTALGANSLFNNTTGSQNVAIGDSSSFSNSIGVQNTVVGHGALLKNIASYSTAIGRMALHEYTGTGYNVAIGANSQYYNLSGTENVSLGTSALRDNVSGSFNTALGDYAMYKTTVASYNIGIGYNTLSTTAGAYNIALGYQAGTQSTTGDYNTFIGRAAGRKMNGSFNVMIGDSSGYSMVNGDGNIGIGGYTLMGTSSTAYDTYGNVVVGYQAGIRNYANYNTIIGWWAGRNETNLVGSHAIIIGDKVDFISLKDYQINIGNRIMSDTITRIGIMKASPQATLDVSGDFRTGPDAANYMTISVSPTGTTTFDGAKSFFQFKRPMFYGGAQSSPAFMSDTISVNSNLLVMPASSGIFVDPSMQLFGAASTYSRVVMRGGISSPAVATALANLLIGTQATIAPASGTSPLFSQMAIKPLTITAGAGTVTNSASLYIEGAATGATNNYTIWTNGGVNRYDGNFNFSGVNGTTGGIPVSDGTKMYWGSVANAKRSNSIVTAATITPTPATSDLLVVSALAENTNFAAPAAGIEGQEIWIRIRDNGTIRIMTWDAAYRASADSPLPVQTIANRTLYLKFMYNAVDLKWDLVGELNNF
jgi:hypothetical protein